MSDLERQLQRYASVVLDEVEPVRAEEILEAGPSASRRPGPGRRVALGAIAAVVSVAIVVGVVVAVGDWLRDPGGVTITAPDEPPVPSSQVAEWGSASTVVEGGGYLWVAMHGRTAGPDLPPDGPGGVVRIDPDSLEAVAWVEVESLSALAYADGVLWAAGFATDVVTKIDAATGEVLAAIDLPTPPGFEDIDGAFVPTNMAATPQAAWVTTARGAVVQIDAHSDEITLHELTPGAPGATIADGTGAWVAEGNVGVSRVSQDGEITTFPLNVDDRTLVVDDIAAVDGRLWAVGTVLAVEGRLSDDDTGALAALDPADGTVTALTRVPVPAHRIVVDGSDVVAWSSSEREIGWAVPTDATGEIDAEPRDLSVPSGAADLVVHDDAIWIVDHEDNSVIRYHDHGADTVDLNLR